MQQQLRLEEASAAKALATACQLAQSREDILREELGTLRIRLQAMEDIRASPTGFREAKTESGRDYLGTALRAVTEQSRAECDQLCEALRTEAQEQRQARSEVLELE